MVEKVVKIIRKTITRRNRFFPYHPASQAAPHNPWHAIWIYQRTLKGSSVEAI